MARYSLRDVFGLLTLAPISAGVVFVAESFSGAIIDYFKLIHRISSVTGWGFERHTLFWNINLILNGIIYGGLFALVMLAMLLLRNRWATLLAFSLPFGILLFQCLRLWIIAAPADAKNALLIAEWSIIPALLAIGLLFLGRRFMNRMTRHESGAETTFFQRPLWRRYIAVATCVIYLSVSAYGWYGMVSYRAEMIEFWRIQDQVKQQQAVR